MSTATWQRLDRWRSHEIREGVWSADFGGPRLSVDIPADGVVRVRFAPTGVHRPERPWDGVMAGDERVDVTVDEELDTAVRLVGGHAVVRVGHGGAIAVEHRGRRVTDDGDRHGARWRRGMVGWTRIMPRDTGYYGFGERTGPLDKRGYRCTSWVTDQAKDHGPRTDSMHAPVPFRVAVAADGRCHGLLVDTTWRSAFDLTCIDEGVESIETEDPELRLWIVAGPSPAEVLDRYTALTGRPVLPPRWALGYQQSRWSYP